MCVTDEATTVNCPPFADSVTEGDIRWEKAVGDTVNVDDVLGEVETDKVSRTPVLFAVIFFEFVELFCGV